MRLDANSLMNIFRSSGKRHLILTGERGSGKTTALKDLLSLSEPSFFTNTASSVTASPARVLPGFTTYAVRPEVAALDRPFRPVPSCIRLRDNTTGQETVIGIPRNYRMCPVPEGFLTIGMEALSHALHAPDDFVCLDEIGFLEESCPRFCAAIEELFEKKRVLAVLRAQPLPFLEKLKSRSDVFVVSCNYPTPSSAGIGAVLMASGESRRFGTNKLLADFHCKPLIQYALDAIADLKKNGLLCASVTVTRSPDTAALCSTQHVPCVLHTEPLLSDTVRIGLDALPALSACLFLTGDQPLLTVQSIKALIFAFCKDQRFIYRLSYRGKPGSPVLFPAAFFQELSQLPPGTGGSAVMQRHPDRVRHVECAHPGELLDADTPEALDQLKTLASFF